MLYGMVQECGVHSFSYFVVSAKGKGNIAHTIEFDSAISLIERPYHIFKLNHQERF
jgi:hypothetical protein